MKAKPGYIIDDQGVERRVLGTLQLTGDGCVIGALTHLYLWHAHGGSDTDGLVLHRDVGHWIDNASSYYSSRKAVHEARANP
jgi:hypothetical protein